MTPPPPTIAEQRRRYRIATRQTRAVTIPTELIGRLWIDGDLSIRSQLDRHLGADVTAACVIAARGGRIPNGSGYPLNYELPADLLGEVPAL